MPRTVVNLSDTVNTFKNKVNTVSLHLGDKARLTTITDSDIVGALNEHDAELGTITSSAMGTTASTVSTAINELDTRLDSINDTLINSAKLHMRDASATNIIKGNIDIGGNLLKTGALTVNVTDDINLDADGGDITLKDGGTTFAILSSADGTDFFNITASGVDRDIKFFGNDGGTSVNALTLDMSDSGTAIFNHDIKLPDSGKVVFGAGSDLQIYHDGISSFIDDAGTGSLRIRSDSTIVLEGTDGINGILVDTDGEVKLYYNGVEKLETTTTGIDVTGNIVVSGTVDGVNVLELETKVEPSRAFGSTFTATTVMSGLNELKTQVDLLDSASSEQISQIGDLASLDTAAKGNLVAAINELDDRIDTDADFRNKVSGNDAGGLGSFSYTQSTGIFEYTGPSNADIRGLISEGEGINYSSAGVISGEDASTSNKGIAKFSSSHFSTSSGTVSIATDGIDKTLLDFGTGTNQISTDALTEGTTNLYHTTTRARGAVSVTDNGGDGALSYNSSTGVFSYTGPSAANVRAHFSAGDDIDISSGEISIEATLNAVTAITTGSNQDFTITTGGTGDIALVSGGDNVVMKGTTANEQLNFTLGTSAQEITASDAFELNATTITMDASADIILDADGGQVRMKHAGTEHFTFNVDATPELDISGGNFILDVVAGYNMIRASTDIYLVATGDDVYMRGAGSTEQILFNLGTTQQTITSSDTLKIVTSDGDIILNPENNRVMIQGEDGASGEIAFYPGVSGSTEQYIQTSGDMGFRTDGLDFIFRSETRNSTNRPVNLILRNTDTSPANGAVCGQIVFQAEDADTSADIDYAVIIGQAADVSTSASTDGRMYLQHRRGNTMTTFLDANGVGDINMYTYDDVILNGGTTGSKLTFSGMDLDISSAANSTTLLIKNSGGTVLKTIYGTTG